MEGTNTALEKLKTRRGKSSKNLKCSYPLASITVMLETGKVLRETALLSQAGALWSVVDDSPPPAGKPVSVLEREHLLWSCLLLALSSG